MVGLRRLVGWGLVSAFTSPWALPAHAQSTASFPEDPPKSDAPRPKAPKASPPPARTPPPPPRPLPPSPYNSSRAPAPKRTPPRARKPVPVTIPATPERSLEPSPYPGEQARPNIVITKRPRFDSNPYGTAEGPPVSGSSPPILPYRTGMPVPAGYEVVTRPNSGLITGGAVGLGLTYGVALIVGATEGFENGTGWLAAPLIGPWGAIGARKYECKSATQTVSEAKKCVRAAVGEVQIITVIAVDGIAQLATAVIMLAGALSSHDELVRQDLVNVAVIPPSDQREPWQLSLSGNF